MVLPRLPRLLIFLYLTTTIAATTYKTPLVHEPHLESSLPKLHPGDASLPFNEQHERAESLRKDYITKPIAKSGQYKAASDVLESLKIDEDNIDRREGYSALPGVTLLGIGFDMLDGGSRTRILQFHPTEFHSMAIGESYLYRQYKVPLAVNIDDQGGSTAKTLWKEWHSAAKYRQSLAAEMGLENYVSALSQCPDVKHVSSNLQQGLVVATRTTDYTLYKAHVLPHVTGFATNNHFVSRDDGDDSNDSEEHVSKHPDPRMDAGMWPSKTFLEATCGHSIPRKDHPPSRLRLPDCMLSNKDFVIGTHNGWDMLQNDQANIREGRSCTEQDMRDAMNFYTEFGSHVVVGISVGGAIEEFKIMNAPGTVVDGGEEDDMVPVPRNSREKRNPEEAGVVPRFEEQLRMDEEELDKDEHDTERRKARDRKRKKRTRQHRHRGHHREMADPLPDILDGGTFTPSERSARWNDFSKFQQRSTVYEEIARKDQYDRGGSGDKHPAKRRRLLSASRGQRPSSPQPFASPILSRSVYINGAYNIPYNLQDVSSDDISAYWGDLVRDEGAEVMFHKTKTLAIADLLLEHSGIRTVCTQDETGASSVQLKEDLKKSAAGRSLIRKSVFFANFIRWLDADSSKNFELLMQSRTLYKRFQRTIGMLIPIATSFRTLTSTIDQLDGGGGSAMMSSLSAWTRLTTLSTLGDQTTPLVRMLAIGSEYLVMQQKSSDMARQYCNTMSNLAMGSSRRLLVNNYAVGEEATKENETTTGDDEKQKPTNSVLPLMSDENTNAAGAFTSSSCLRALNMERRMVESAMWVSATPVQSAVGWIFEKSLGSHRDMCVGLLSNELDTSRDYDVDTRSRPHVTSSTAAYCKGQTDVVFKELCWMTADVLSSIIMQYAGDDFRSQFSIMTSTPATLSQILGAMFQHDNRFKPPVDNSLTERVQVANRVCNVFYGSSKNIGVTDRTEQEILSLHPKSQKNLNGGDAAAQLHTMSEKLVRTMAGDTSNPIVAATIAALDADIMKLQNSESCHKIESTVKSLQLLLSKEKKKENQQQCYTCLRTIRPPPSSSSQGICDNEQLYKKKAINVLMDALDECGVSKSTFIQEDGKDNQDKKQSGTRRLRRRRRRLLQVLNPSDLAVAMSLSSDLTSGGNTIVGAGSPTSTLMKKMHDQRLQTSLLPTTCGGILYQPKEMEKLEKGLHCVQKKLVQQSSTSSGEDGEGASGAGGASGGGADFRFKSGATSTAAPPSRTNIGQKACKTIVSEVEKGTTALTNLLAAALGRSAKEVGIGDVVAVAKAYHKMRKYSFVDGVERRVNAGGTSHNSDGLTSVIVNPQLLQRDRCLSDQSTVCCDLHYCTEQEEATMFRLYHLGGEMSTALMDGTVVENGEGGEGGEVDKDGKDGEDNKTPLEAPPGFGGVPPPAPPSSSDTGEKPSSPADPAAPATAAPPPTAAPAAAAPPAANSLLETSFTPTSNNGDVLDYLNSQRAQQFINHNKPFFNYKMDPKSNYKGDKNVDMLENFVLSDSNDDDALKSGREEDEDILSGLTKKQREAVMASYVAKSNVNIHEFQTHKTLFGKIHSARIGGQAKERSIAKRKDLLAGVNSIGIGIRSWGNGNCNRIFGQVPDGLELPPVGLGQKYSIPAGFTVFKLNEFATSDLKLMESFRDVVAQTTDQKNFRVDDDDRIDTDGRNVLDPSVLETFPSLAKGNPTAKWTLELALYTIRLRDGALASQSKVRQPGSGFRFSDHIFENDAESMSLHGINTPMHSITNTKLDMDSVINENEYKEEQSAEGKGEGGEGGGDEGEREGEKEGEGEQTNQEEKGDAIEFIETGGPANREGMVKGLKKNPMKRLRESFMVDTQFRNSICWDIDDQFVGVLLPDCILTDQSTTDIDIELLDGKDLDLMQGSRPQSRSSSSLECTPQQVLDTVKWLHLWGDHVVTGVTVGCSATHTMELDSEVIRGHGAGELVRAYTIIQQQKDNGHMRDKASMGGDDKNGQKDQGYHVREETKHDSKNEMKEFDNENPSKYFDTPSEFYDPYGKKSSWIHERRRRRLLDASTLGAATSGAASSSDTTHPLPLRGSSSVKYIGGDTGHIQSNIGLLSLKNKKLQKWLKTCPSSGKVIREQLTPMEAMLTSFPSLIDDCMIDNPLCVQEKNPDPTTKEQCKKQIEKLKKKFHKNAIFNAIQKQKAKKEKAREVGQEVLDDDKDPALKRLYTDEMYLDDVVYTKKGQVLIRKIELISSVRKWLGAKAIVLSHDMLQVQMLRRRAMNAGSSIRELFQKGILASRNVEMLADQLKEKDTTTVEVSKDSKAKPKDSSNILGASTPRQLWNHINVMCGDKGNGGLVMVEKYLHMIGNYKLFYGYRSDFVIEMCHLKSQIYKKEIVLNGKYDGNVHLLKQKVLLNEKVCVDSEMDSNLFTATGVGGRSRSSFPSSRNDMDDPDGISASAFLNNGKDSVHAALFALAQGEACGVCVGVVVNELKKETSSALSVEGWDQDTLSSSTLYCESLDTSIRVAMCKMVVEHLIVMVNQRLYQNVGVAPSLNTITLKEALTNLLTNDITFQSLWDTIQTKGEMTLDPVSGMPNVQMAGGEICQRVFSCTSTDSSSKTTKQQTRTQKDILQSIEVQKRKDEAQGLSLKAVDDVMEQIIANSRAAPEKEGGGGGGGGQKGSDTNAAVDRSIQADNDMLCSQMEEMKTQLHRYDELEREGWMMKTCYVCESYMLHMRVQRTSKPVQTLGVQEAAAATTEETSGKASESICKSHLMEPPKTPPMDLKKSFAKCGDPKTVLQLQARKDTSESDAALIQTGLNALTAKEQRRQQVQSLRSSNGLRHANGLHRLLATKNDGVTSGVKEVQSKIVSATTGIPLSCEKDSSNNAFTSSSPRGPARADVESAITMMECLKTTVPSDMVVAMDTAQCTTTIQSIDGRLIAREQKLANALGTSSLPEGALQSDVLNHMHELTLEAYDNQGKIRGSNVIDASILSFAPLRPTLPLCVDIGVCSSEGSRRTRGFLRNMARITGDEEKSGVEKIDVKEGDGFVPPGW